MLLFGFTVALLLPALVVSSDQHQLSKEYNEIDKYLVKELPESEDLKANFELAQKWLQKRRGRLCGLSKCLSSSLNGALESFVDLYVASREEKCYLSTVKILRQVKTVAGCGFYWQFVTETSPRVTKLVHAIAQEMASGCVSASEIQYNEVIKQLDQSKLSIVRQHLDLLMQPTMMKAGKYLEGASDERRLMFEINQYFYINPCFKDELHRTSFDLAKSNLGPSMYPTHTSKKLFMQKVQDNIRSFLEAFYLEPCRYFKDELTHILRPDYEHHRIQDWGVVVSRKEFYLDLGRHKWCQDLIEDSEALVRFLFAMSLRDIERILPPNQGPQFTISQDSFN